MPEFFIPLSVLLIGIATGFGDSTVGSGGLLSIPLLILLGLPPQIAIAIDRLGSVGQTLAALLVFWRAKKIRWNYILVFTVLSLFGSYIGATILLSFDPKLLEKTIGLFLLFVLPFLFLQSSIGIKQRSVSILKKGIGYIVYFFIMVYNGFFGTGSGPFATFTALYFFGFTIIEANATSIIPWFVLSLSSLVIFARGGIVDYQKGIILLVGMTIGGYLGAHVAVAKGDAWIKRLFILVVVISGVKLLFF